MDQHLFDQALVFAAKAHQGQYRKGTDIPYITHPVALAMMLLELNCADEVIIAALLHDVVEDTAVTLAAVEAEFGEQVSNLVQAVTEPDREAEWEVRKTHTIHKLRQAPLPGKLLACADKLHNIRSIHRDYEAVGEQVWQRFKRAKTEQAWYYRGLAESLSHGIPNLDSYPIFATFQQEVNQLFGSDD